MELKVGDRVRFVNKYKLNVNRFTYEWDKGLETKIYAIKNNKARIDGGFEIPLECFALIEKKQANDNHSILNGLTNEKYYEKSAMQPLEVMQALMTEEQFKGFLLGNCIKYCMRKNYKGQHDSDEYKARQYAYWLELADMGQTINPTEDKVPDSYRFKVV
jgi:hypothetical protein